MVQTMNKHLYIDELIASPTGKNFRQNKCRICISVAMPDRIASVSANRLRRVIRQLIRPFSPAFKHPHIVPENKKIQIKCSVSGRRKA